MNKEMRTKTGGISRVHFERAVREPGFSMSAHHCHPYFELYYVERGTCRLMVGDAMYDLNDGDFMLIPPQALHFTRYLHSACKRVDIYFRGEDVCGAALSALPEGRAFFSQTRVIHVPEPHQGQISALFSRMATEERIADEHSGSMLLLQLQELFLLCNRVCTFSMDIPADIDTADRQVVLAARFISKNYMQPLTTSDIAAAAGFSPNYLCRKFRETLGIGIHEYLVFTRLQHAAAELVSTNDTVTQIALRCGFSNSNYFKDAFKKKYGVTPRQYRKE